jgi:hypothetical protein
VFFTEVLTSPQLIVRATAQRDLPNGMTPRERPRLGMVELEELSRVAAAPFD